MKNHKNTNLVYGTLLGSIIAAMLLGFGLAYLLTSNAKVKFVVSPIDAKYTIGGKEYTGGQNITVSSGDYKILFYRELYKDKIVNANVERGKDQTINVKLSIATPVDKGDSKYNKLTASGKKIIDLYSQQGQITDERWLTVYDGLSSVEKNIIDSYMDKTLQDEETSLLTVHPVISLLPQYTDTYRVDITYEGTPTIPIRDITLLSGGDKGKEVLYKKEAIEWLESQDPNYAKLELRYGTE